MLTISASVKDGRAIASEEISLDNLYELFRSARENKQDDIAKSIQEKIFKIRNFPFDQEIYFSKNSDLFLFEWRISKISSEKELEKLYNNYIDHKYKDVVSRRLAEIKK